jgi:diguanylate cyclase (GGDEF)-like protein
MSVDAMFDQTRLLDELLEIGIALTSERDLDTLLERILAQARRVTRAEAGTLFLRDGDHLRFAVVQNDFLEARLGTREMRRRLQAEPMELSEPSLAGHVAQTGEIINVSNAYAIAGQRTVAFNPAVDETTEYATRSVFVVPLLDPSGTIVGVLELLNARGEDGTIVPFDPGHEKLIRALASQAAVVIRNARLEDLSFKDALTDLFNRRYFELRLDEEAKRAARFGHPLSLVYVDLDGFKRLNEDKGRPAADEVLKEVARLLVKHSRSFTIVARRDGDDFAAILANTPKAGAMSYSERIRSVIEQHPFAPGPVTASLGVAAFPADATTALDLMARAQQALDEAKGRGRNRVAQL